MDGYIDGAYWLSAEGSGCYSVSGWILAADRGRPVEVDIRLPEGAFLGLTPMEARPDVVAVHTGANLHCGFDFDLPGTQPGPIDLTFRTEGEPDLQWHIEPLVCDETAAASAAFRIGTAGRAKLANLLLNEGERLTHRPFKTSRPISIYIDPAFACNLTCPHCISQSLRDQGFNRPIMKPALFDALLSTYGDTLIKVTMALWGEPLLNKNVPSFVRALKQRGIYVETSTNLSLPLTQSHLEAVMQAGFDSMRLSIDGASQAVYEKYRVGGSLSLVLDNLTRMVAFKRQHGRSAPTLNWQYLIWPWNDHEVDAARQLAQQIGADSFYTIQGDPWTGPRSTRSRTAEDDSQPLAEDLRGAILESRRHRTHNRHHVGCDFLDHTLAFNSDGAIHPCCYVTEPSHAFGQFRIGEEADHFNSARIVAARQMVRDLPDHGPSPCIGCGSLTRGYIPDQLTFRDALDILRATYPLTASD